MIEYLIYIFLAGLGLLGAQHWIMRRYYQWLYKQKLLEIQRYLKINEDAVKENGRSDEVWHAGFLHGIIGARHIVEDEAEKL